MVTVQCQPTWKTSGLTKKVTLRGKLEQKTIMTIDMFFWRISNETIWLRSAQKVDWMKRTNQMDRKFNLFSHVTFQSFLSLNYNYFIFWNVFQFFIAIILNLLLLHSDELDNELNYLISLNDGWPHIEANQIPPSLKDW